MAEKVKAYFIAPTRDCPPSGPIALGSIITSPLSPELSLNPPLPINQTTVSRRTEANWKLEVSKYKKGKVGLWTSFLQIAGVGADLHVSHEQSAHSVYEFERLDTYTFWPSKSYVKASVMAPEVQAFLEGKRCRQNVYMITGISIAVGATVSHMALRRRGVFVHAGVDGTTSGVPFSAGPKVNAEWGGMQGTSSQRGSDYVFAFRIREICYTMKRGIVEREYTKGALFGLGDIGQGDSEMEAKRKVGVGDEHFELLGLAEEDVTGDDVGVDVREVEDEYGEICECVTLE